MSGKWRRSVRIWLPGALLCVLGLGLLGAYRLVLAEEAELGRGLLSRRVAELEEIRLEELHLQNLLDAARTTKDGLAHFYDGRLSTEQQMLTKVIAEVKRLAEQAGLEPAAIGYDKDTLERQDMVQQSLDFRVIGTYAQLRTLVNFIELSETFLVLERISLRGIDEQNVGQLAINLRITALFSARPDSEPHEGGAS